MMRGNSRRRRGVLLLIVLGLLAVFCLIGLMFVLTSAQQRRSAVSGQKLDQVREPPQQLLNEAFAQAVRGSKEPGTVTGGGTPVQMFRIGGIGAHSLLETMYGGNVLKSGKLYPTTSNGMGVVSAGPRVSAISTSSQLTPLAGPPSSSTVGQILQFTPVDVTQTGAAYWPNYTSPAPPLDLTTANAPASLTKCAGCVLTFLNGPAAGCSTRVLAYVPSGGAVVAPGALQIQATDQITCAALSTWLARYGTGTNGDSLRFLINGSAFSGVGFGYNPQQTTGTNMLDAKSATVKDGKGNQAELALLPTYCDPMAAPSSTTTGTPQNTVGDNCNPIGGANTDYTAVDYQHMLLAMVLPQYLAGTVGSSTTNDNHGIVVPIPSLHRSELNFYWYGRGQGNAAGLSSTSLSRTSYYNNGATSAFPAELLRATSFRPNPYDHPAFWQNVNPNYNPFWDGQYANSSNGTYRWDVDNLGTGVPDSIWVDLGLPVRATPDGRLYKPLFAFLVTDLDGRININAHGTINQQTAANAAAPPTTTGTTPAYKLSDASSTFSTLPNARGQGYGPAEINPQWVLNAYVACMQGSGTNEGRYGAPAGSGVAGTSGNYSPLRRDRFFEYAGQYLSFQTGSNLYLDSYGTPPDIFGTGVVGVDPAGRPIYCGVGTLLTALTQVYNSPYELNLNRAQAWRCTTTGTATTTIDNPFTPTELERVLRPYDVDSSMLPQRLYTLGGQGNSTSAGTIIYSRHEVTTEQWDLPVPALMPTSDAAATTSKQTFSHIADLLNMYAIPQTAWADMLPYEVLAGLRMDINRPFGYGRPKKPAAAVTTPVDDPTETYNPAAWSTTAYYPQDPPGGTNNWLYDVNGKAISDTYSTTSTTKAVPFDLNNGAATTSKSAVATGTAARQLYARHLYCLACLLMDSAGRSTMGTRAHVLGVPGDSTSDTAPYLGSGARMLAQWAINCASFRDRTSIMTPFYYDQKLFETPKSYGGWNPDNTALHAVWGCRRPELLITETLAFHDRRTEDTNQDNGKKQFTTKSPNAKATDKDPNFDSRYRPQGSLYVELYNPGNDLDAPFPEMHKWVTTPQTNGFGQWGIDLTKLSATGNSPIWRMIIAYGNGNSPSQATIDPDDPTQTTFTPEREIYFVSNPGIAKKGQVQHYPSAAQQANIAPILPGRFAVIGPGEQTAPSFGDKNKGQTFLGFDQPTANTGETALPAGDARFIELNPSATINDTAAPSSTSYPVRVVGNLAGAGNNDLANANGGKIKPPVAIIIDAASTSAALRLSISEPYAGYTTTGYTASTQQVNPIQDTPLDSSATLPTGLSTYITSKYGTQQAVRIVYLQRLADPTQAYNSTTNPYRTIDAMSIDLTVFNGTGYSPMAAKDYPEPGFTAGTWAFNSRQRGDRLDTNSTKSNVWMQDDITKNPATVASTSLGGSFAFPYKLQHTLGYVNPFAGPPGATSTSTFTTVTSGTTVNRYAGDPQAPFPWFVWNSRPYANPLELLFVPWGSSSELLKPVNFSLGVNSTFTTANPYVAGTTAASFATVPYSHLMDLFDSTVTSNGTVTSQGIDLYRLLEYVRVPSRFVGLETQINPALTQPPSTATAGYTSHHFHPPFHWLSSYREPGRINLNSLNSRYVWQGLMNAWPGGYSNIDWGNASGTTSLWVPFLQSRRWENKYTTGFSATPTTELQLLLAMRATMPTRIENPFRSYAGQYLVPLHSTASGGTDMGANIGTAANATLLRQDPRGPQGTLTNAQPLFANQLTTALSSPAANPQDPSRHAYFNYAGLQRLSNLTTTRSNVYAVWITMGYFECRGYSPTASPKSNGSYTQWAAAHPDGVELVQELGADTGDITRHRAFYIFDRSIPVGFARGHDLNYEKAVLVKRFIE